MLAPWLLTVLLISPQQGDALSRARQAYNAERFDDAISLAAEARQIERLATSAALVFARASLERYRLAGDVVDVATARQALVSVDPARLTAAEASEFRLATAELLFVDEQFGSATEVLAHSLLTIPDSQRERVFDWWASALDRHAQLGPDAERQRRYSRLLSGVEKEFELRPLSAAVIYWLAAATRGAEDMNRAWSLAVAGWIQAPMIAAGPQGARLRTDLDRLMRDAIIPERARRAVPPADPQALEVALAAEWESIKQRWTR